MTPEPGLTPPLDLLIPALPSASRSELLRACLLPGPAAAAAWQRWRDADAPNEWLARNPGYRRLSPLLAESLTGAGATLLPGDSAWLEAARLRERPRMDRFRAALREVLRALENDGVAYLVGKGVTAAESAWPDARLRHCHDVDLLVSEASIDRASRVLTAAGLREDASTPAPSAARALKHAHGVTVLLHDRAFDLPTTPLRVEELAGRAARCEIAGLRAPVPAPDDLLLLICGHATSHPGRGSGMWVCDAHFVVEHSSNLDWQRLRESAAVAGVSARLAAALSYLVGSIGTRVPEAALGELVGDARRASRLERDTLIRSALGEGASVGDLWRAVQARSRLTLVRSALLPHPRYLRWSGGTARRGALVLWLRRVGRILTRSLTEESDRLGR